MVSYLGDQLNLWRPEHKVKIKALWLPRTDQSSSMLEFCSFKTEESMELATDLKKTPKTHQQKTPARVSFKD